MKLSDVVGHSGLSGYAEIAMVLFLAAFAIVLVRVLWPARRDELDRVSRLPLDDDAPHAGGPR